MYNKFPVMYFYTCLYMQTQVIQRLSYAAAIALSPAHGAEPLFPSQSSGLTRLLVVCVPYWRCLCYNVQKGDKISFGFKEE